MSMVINPILYPLSTSKPTSIPLNSPFKPIPSCSIRLKTRSLLSQRPFSERLRKGSVVLAAKMSVTEESIMGFDNDSPSELIESEIVTRPRRIVLFVEPSPFAYVSGYKNRFQNFIKYLREMGDEVMVVTTHEGVPAEFHGAKLIGSRSF